MRVRWTPAAAKELFEASDFYDEQRFELGNEFLEEVERSLALIKRYPNASPLLSGRARQRETNRFPYGLVYLVHETDVVIIAVAHLKRRPMYWRKRLDDFD